MKKLWFVIVLIILSACTTESLELKEKIATEMARVASFEVNEVFSLKQYGRNNDAPDNRTITIDNKIRYDEDVIYTINSMKEDLDLHNVETRKIYSFESYKDWFNNVAFVSDTESDWYEVELSQMHNIGMGSIDPISIINMILDESKDLDNSQIENSNYIVTDIPSDLFEEMFGSSVFRFIDMSSPGSPYKVGYPYKVEVSIKYDDDNRIEFIDFDLSDLLKKYRDYYVYEIEIDSVITFLTANLRLDFFNYNQIDIEFDEETIDWVLDKDYEIEIGDKESYALNQEFGKVSANIEYINTTDDYNIDVNLELNKDIKYLYYELYFYSKEELIEAYYSYWNNAVAFDILPLLETRSKEKIDQIYFKMRYATNESSSIKEVKSVVEYSINEPVHEIDLDIREFTNEPKDVVPNVLVEHTGFDKELKTYNMYIDVYSKIDVRHADITFHVYLDDERKSVFHRKDLDLKLNEHLSFIEEISYMPDAIYVDISYNSSYLVSDRTKINLDFKAIEGAFDYSIYKESESTRVTIVEFQDVKWFAFKYRFNIDFSLTLDDFNAYIYFVDDEKNLIGWEYVYQVETENTYDFVSRLYDEKIDKIFIDINYSTDDLNSEKITGVIITPIE
ncbi:hypothetical protein RI065_03535 [Mycoplasmatota bacterium zrk1]